MSKIKDCCVTGCKNKNIGADSGVIFYRFPDNKVLRKKWIEAVVKHEVVPEEFQPDNDSFICNVHFVSGQKNANDWHPDYIPSVFRSLRKGPTKAKGKHLDEDEDEIKPKKRKISFKRPSLATPNRNTMKNRSKKVVLLKEETLTQVMNADDDKLITTDYGEGFESLTSDDLINGGLTGNSSGSYTTPNNHTHKLKTLSVVLERTSEKKIKLSTGEIAIKEEPYVESESALSPVSVKSPRKSNCRRCRVLEIRMKKLENNIRTGPGVDRCRRCPTLESKIDKMEDDMEQMESRMDKCQKCYVFEQKFRKIENNYRKSQAEVNKLQSKLVTVEISDETLKKYKNKVKMYTGFPNYEALLLIYDHVRPHLPTESVKFLSPFQMLIIVLMKLKLNFPFWDLTYRFGASPNYIQTFYPQYVAVMEKHLSHVVLWPKANLHYRLEVLAGNLKQSFAVLQKDVEVETLLKDKNSDLTEDEKITRVCGALYHISQLVSSNHSQQLIKILKSQDDSERSKITDNKENTPADAVMKKLEEFENADKGEKQDTPVEDKLNGGGTDTDINDADIFLEDFTKDISSGTNSDDSLKLECKHLRREIESLNQKLGQQFKFYTGMRNFEVFNNLLGFLQPHVTHITEVKLSYFKQLLLVLMRLKLNLEVNDLSYMFKVDTDYTVHLTRLWIEVIVRKLSKYIDWPIAVNDNDAEKRLLGSVKLKYQILWSPHCAPRNKITGRQREKFDPPQLLRACAALYNIDDIEVFKHGKKESKASQEDNDYNSATNEELEKHCIKLRSELYDLRKCTLTSLVDCFSEESLMNNDRLVQYYTGFNSYEMLAKVCDFVVPEDKSETRKGITPFQQFFAVLLRLKLNISTLDLSYRFGMGHSLTHKLTQDWLLLLHSRLGPYITWPDDDNDVEFFTDMLRKTYLYIKNNVSPRYKDTWKKNDTGVYDIATLVCAGLYNIGDVSFSSSDSEFDSFDDEW